MNLTASIALCGMVGVLFRFGLYELCLRLGTSLVPATFAINVLGSFTIGVLYGDSVRILPAFTPLARHSLMAGLLGGFTTFSAFSLETIQIWQSGRPLFAVAYAVGSPSLGVAAALLGIWVMR